MEVLESQLSAKFSAISLLSAKISAISTQLTVNFDKSRLFFFLPSFTFSYFFNDLKCIN